MLFWDFLVEADFLFKTRQLSTSFWGFGILR